MEKIRPKIVNRLKRVGALASNRDMAKQVIANMSEEKTRELNSSERKVIDTVVFISPEFFRAHMMNKKNWYIPMVLNVVAEIVIAGIGKVSIEHLADNMNMGNSIATGLGAIGFIALFAVARSAINIFENTKCPKFEIEY